MTPSPAGGRLIEAAGGVLWRPAPDGAGVEVALVHRPKYDDWSLAKGKLSRGEHALLGAVREVWEETGYVGVPGRPLGEIRYLKEGAPKRVRYWAMAATSGAFTPNAEVDEVRWLPPREGQNHLLAERDRDILVEFARDPQPTFAVLLVRHASAGERANWPGDDRDRPLDDAGRRQADALVPLLETYAVTHVLSADVLRCTDTVAPYAATRRLTVESDPLLSEAGQTADPTAALNRVLSAVAAGDPTVVCSQRKAMPGLLSGVCAAFGHDVPADLSTRKGGWWTLHVTAGTPRRLVAVENSDPAV